MPDLTLEDMTIMFPNTTRQTWAQMRHEGTGPRYYKVGRRVYYRPADVEAWKESQLRSRTDELPKDAA
ncbi:helix-turn-helix transcriptional regulator [Corynebacterium hindlerae]|uniref:helix-turn-helix transcriptional regulator n=1 Tax=Corynebacterium hindlerae TaxID=699041 RepID=UPI003AABAA75